jgi:hypothetical protein
VTLIQPDAPLALPSIAIFSVMYVHISGDPSVSSTGLRGRRGCPPQRRRRPQVPAAIIPPDSLAMLTNPAGAAREAPPAGVREMPRRAILRRAFDLGVAHFDLANNYGPR